MEPTPRENPDVRLATLKVSVTVLTAPVSNPNRPVAVVNWVLERPPGKFVVLFARGIGFVVALNPTENCGTIPASLKLSILTQRAAPPNLITWLPFTHEALSIRLWFLGARPCCRKF